MPTKGFIKGETQLLAFPSQKQVSHVCKQCNNQWLALGFAPSEHDCCSKCNGALKAKLRVGKSLYFDCECGVRNVVDVDGVKVSQDYLNCFRCGNVFFVGGQ